MKRVTLRAEEGASLSSGSLRLYAIAEEDDGEGALHPVGAVDLYAYDPLNRRCAVGIMVATEQRRRGYATAMLQELERMGRETFALHQLYADIAATNEVSLALFGKAGYRECGRFEEWLVVKGRYVDCVRMQRGVGGDDEG